MWSVALVCINEEEDAVWAFEYSLHLYASHYLLTYLLTRCSRVLLEKLTGFAANQEIPRILWSISLHLDFSR